MTIAPLFILYDYTFRPDGTSTKEEALEVAHEAGVVCTDEVYLHPDPHPTRDAWCDARIAYTEKRLAALEPGTRTVLVNHWPLVREPTRVLWYPEFAQWCGTERTADWHERFRAASVVYGHLHIPGRSGPATSRTSRCRSATRANGASGAGRRAARAPSCPSRRRADLAVSGAIPAAASDSSRRPRPVPAR